MSNPVIISAVRTAGGKFGGGLMKLTGPELGTIAIKAAIERAGIKGEDVDEVILGTGWQAGVGANPARIAMYHAGIPCSVPAFTVNIRCGSGLRTMMLAADKIRLGDANVVVAGGMESASNVPYILPKARWGFRMGEQKALDVLHKDGFLCPIAGKLMGESCEDIAAEYHITRQEQDEFALASHQKAAAASKAGLFKDEIVPVVLKDRKKGEIVIDTDEIFRADTSLEQLAKLPTIFKKDGGTITAGSSSALCDCSSIIIIASAEWAKEHGIKPIAEILGYAAGALEAERYPLGPVVAMPKALERAGLKLSDMELIEINEAFAAQVIACHRELKFDMDKLNVHGSAIALGHPIGATGAKITTTLINALGQQGKELGISSACIGGGQGVAMVVKRL
ncbi:MAG: thiolase family protein [Pyramidobacter sp.]|nr:thiolase family protein [Pyramidobacter sp.]